MEDPHDTDAVCLTDVLTMFSLTLHVHGPARQHGHTLDIVINMFSLTLYVHGPAHRGSTLDIVINMFSLTLHVHGPAHQHGRTLDIVITSDKIADVTCLYFEIW